MAGPPPVDAHLEGELVGFRYTSEDGAFAVARVRPPGQGEIVVVGPLGHVQEGQHLRLTGRWMDHPSFGRQFKAEGVLVEDPRTTRGIERYLSSGAVHGLGPEFARRVVEHFGTDTLRIIAEEPTRLTEVPGIGEKRMARIRAQWEQDRQGREIMAALRGYGLGAALAARIVERWGKDAPALVARDPFRLCAEIRGVGFRTADAIARANGIGPEDPARAEAALLHLLREAEGQGHVFLPRAELHARLEELQVEPDQADPALDRLALRGGVVLGPALDPSQVPVYLPALARAEAFVARRLRELARARLPEVPAALVAQAQAGLGLQLSPGQQAAVQEALRHGLTVITGGPGTGKTTIVRVLVGAAEAAQEGWKLAAPTGRAARRLSDATGRPARTIHRLLEFNGRTGAFTRDLDLPLEARGVLVDEASMVDLRLMEALLRALPDGCRLVLVGDADQLPSVGAGRVLADVIASGEIPVATLHEVYRQAADSGIVRAAWRVHEGQVPRSAEDRRDFFVLEREEVAQARETLVEVCVRRLPRLGFDPLREVQVLTPMHAGPLGTQALNQELQALLNPTGPACVRGEKVLRVGDRVLQLRNNYDLDVFNGDVGFVVQADEAGVVVDFGEGGQRQEVAITGEGLLDLELAYAMSIHKSQGSEYPAVVVVLHRAHRIMLRRNLLYTALTRARRFCCLLGDPWAFETACAAEGGDERWTRLADRLREDGPARGARDVP